jgi:hypothetical protein
MKEVLKYAAANRLLNKNIFLKKAFENKYDSDRTMKIISKEVTDLIVNLFNKARKRI